LLGGRPPTLTLLHPELQEVDRTGELPSAQRTPAPLLDWGEALDVPSFYDREAELATLMRWVVEERCRLVSMLGLGGIGKSALVVPCESWPPTSTWCSFAPCGTPPLAKPYWNPA
jgi:hypothetical protein